MSFVTASYRPAKDGGMDIPRTPEGEPFRWACIFSQQTRVVFAEDVEEMVAAITGDPFYLMKSEQEKCVARIQSCINYQVTFQARINLHSQMSGAWDKCSEQERAILNGSRFEQPRGWGGGEGLQDVWRAPNTPLVLVSTGYFGGTVEQVPVAGQFLGEHGQILWLCPETAEDFLESLQKCNLVDVLQLGFEE